MSDSVVFIAKDIEIKEKYYLIVTYDENAVKKILKLIDMINIRALSADHLRLF